MKPHAFEGLHRFSLRAWLALGFNSVIVLALIVAAASLLTQQRFVGAVHKLLTVDGRIAALSQGSNVAMLKARRAEKDFLLYRREFGFDETKSRYVTLLRANLAEIRQNMAEIRELTDAPEAIEQTGAIDRAVMSYETGFLAIVELYGALGHFNTGLEDKLRRKAHEIESIVSTGDHDRLSAGLLALRRHEKDFIARGLDKYFDTFAQGAQRFKADLATANLTPERKAELVRLADEYLGLFEQYVQTQGRIDAEEAAYLSAAHAVEPVLEKLQIDAHGSESATRDDAERVGRIATWTISGLALLALVFGVTAARLVARIITQSVDECLEFAKRVARGELMARLTPKGRHEFGTLAVALNDMTGALQAREAGLQQAEAMAKLAHAVTRADGAFESWSDTLPRLIGTDPAGMPRSTQAWLEIVHPDERASVRGKYIEAGATGERMEAEYRVRRADGAWAHLRHVVEPLPGDAGTGGRARWFNTLQDVTEQKRAGEQLRASEERYRDLVENSFDLVCTHDLEGKLLSVNEAGARLSGYSRDALLGMSLADLLAPAVRGTFPAYLDEIRTRGAASGLMRVQTASGEQRWWEYQNTLRTDGVAVPIVRATSHDVTERMRAEKALRGSEAKLRAIFENAVEGIFLVDAEGRVVSANPMLARMLGYESPEQMGREIRSVARDVYAEKGARGRFRELLHSNQVVNDFETLWRRKDGGTFWVSLSARVIERETGGTIHHLGMARDITERKQADAILRESELRFRELAENIQEVFFLVDPASRRTLYVSPAYETIWDRSCASLYDNPDSWTDLVHPGDRERVLANLERAEQTGLVDHEYRIVRTDCTTRWIHARSFPIRNEAGKLYRIAGIAEDITERRSAEERVRRLNRVYAVLSGINALIVRVRDRDELLRNACEVAVQAGGFRAAWAGIVDPETHEVRLLARAGAPLGGLATVRRSAKADVLEGRGIIGRALREQAPQIVNNAFTDERLIYRTETLASGFRSFVILPLLVNGAAVGALSLLSDETGFFDEDEMKLLRELAGDIAFALENIEKNRQLDYLAYYDPLTGLANRSLFQERLSQFLAESSHGEAKLALVLADIERLKTINESLGRQAGDELLRQFAKCLAGATEPARAARVGADQFAVILPAVKGKSDAARQMEEVMRKCFAHPYKLNGVEVRISARSGVALCANHPGDAETLLRNAEAALQKAKETGERHAFYTSDMTAGVSATLTLENKLRQALERDEFVLHYQPKVDLASGRIAGVEALIRWSSPELGLVPPSEFVPLLESTGLIQEAGTWALKKAVDDHLRWQRSGLAAPRIAVNVSAMQLRRRDFVAIVKQAIACGANPTGIDLELTESLVMRDVEGNIEKLRMVHDLGLNIAIDDFGTGYSSLGYLAKLPVQTLKIDRSFIITMLDDPNTMTLVSTMISLAHSLGLKVVAEGVDSEEQQKFLRLLRCDEIQGYLFSRPLPFDGITALLGRETQLLAA